MEHRFGQRIRPRELPELRLEVVRSPTPVECQGGRRSPGAGVIVRATELPLERVMNSIRNGLGMQETEIAREPS
jgi:hypothetical protein